MIYEDELAERRLKIGDIYRIPAGSAFYLMNAEEGQRLHIICSIDPSESLGLGVFQVRHYLSDLRNILSLNLEGLVEVLGIIYDLNMIKKVSVLLFFSFFF